MDRSTRTTVESWAGVAVTDAAELDGGEVGALLDPACYYADPEVELAYIEWTDTGGDAFVEHYREIAGIDDGLAERAPVYGLYPLLTYVRHFGTEYVDPLRACLSELGY